jgi:cytochrome c-type biogenesis protein CcmH/NrfF
MRFVAFFLVLLVAGSVVAPAIAQDLTQEQIDEEARRLHRHFMSPFCPGKNLADCTSSQAAVWRDKIRDWVAEGHDEAWIEARLIDEFGEQILSAPKFRGFNALVWLFPGIAVLVGLAVIFGYLQKQHAMKLDSSVPGRDVPDDYKADPDLEARLEQELQQRKA